MSNREWKGQQIAELLDSYGDPVCPDCKAAMAPERCRVVVFKSGVAIVLTNACPKCGFKVSIDSQLETAKEN